MFWLLFSFSMLCESRVRHQTSTLTSLIRTHCRLRKSEARPSHTFKLKNSKYTSAYCLCFVARACVNLYILFFVRFVAYMLIALHSILIHTQATPVFVLRRKTTACDWLFDLIEFAISVLFNRKICAICYIMFSDVAKLEIHDNDWQCEGHSTLTKSHYNRARWKLRYNHFFFFGFAL